ncbi:hypothetical protein [Kibdelosporangium philippinense]|uniref:hypothetical protein n=1 Tax=Kibdelosporangium philippinense TaxID=211113 RepID=UPI0036173DA5
MTAYPVFEMRDGERLLTASGPLIRHVGSLIGNRVQVPHPADTSGLVRLDRLPHRPLDASVAGRFPIDDWPGDDSIGWWVEARAIPAIPPYGWLTRWPHAVVKARSC